MQSSSFALQARKFGNDIRAGLIPSVTLQERRKAFDQSAPDPDAVQYKVFGCGLRRKKKVKMVYTARVAEGKRLDFGPLPCLGGGSEFAAAVVVRNQTCMNSRDASSLPCLWLKNRLVIGNRCSWPPQ